MSGEKPIVSKVNRNSTHICGEEKSGILKDNIQPRPHSSGFKSFLNWFKKVEKLQQAENRDSEDHTDDSSSISSGSSTATAASFAFLEPTGYKPYGDALEPKKFITPGPYTDTYKRLIKERERRRDLDKDITLRKKYNLHASGLTLNGTLKPSKEKVSETKDVKIYDTFSLPAMHKISNAESDFVTKEHRRATSETKFVRPHSFVYVKGKRKAPPPPDGRSTLVKQRSMKKRQAPQPPKMDDNPLVEQNKQTNSNENKVNTGLLHSKSDNYCNAPHDSELSPRPWYKRQFSENKAKEKKIGTDDIKAKHKSEFSDNGFFRYSKFFDSKKFQISEGNSSQEKRFSHILPNISELDREAAEILEKHKKQFREENNNMSKDYADGNLAKSRSAKELITKLNDNSENEIAKYSEKRTENALQRNVSSRSQIDKNKTKDLFCDKQLVNRNAESSVWKCVQCKKDNDVQRIICFNCYARRPRDILDNNKDTKEETLETNLLSVQSQIENISLNNDNKINSSDIKDNKVSECVPSTSNQDAEKQKLRELLKEMKNSLPKRQKDERKDENIVQEIVSQEPNQSYIAIVNVTNKTFAANKPEKNDVKKVKMSTSAQTENIMKLNHQNNLYENIEKSKKNENDINPKVLLKELEYAISKGNDKLAAELAKKLAHLKVNCTVLSSTDLAGSEQDKITINIYIEDQDSQHGPLPIKISKLMTIADLKKNVEKEMNIPGDLQRWIIGKQLAVDMDARIDHYNNGDFDEPMFLYLVSVEVKPETVEKPSAPPLTPVSSLKTKDLCLPLNGRAPIAKPESFNITLNSPLTPLPGTSKPVKSENPPERTTNHYLELVNLDNMDIITNVESFECPICMVDCKPGDGVILRDCIHSFCKECLANTVKFCEEVEIRCPYRDENYSCQSVVQEREIKSLVSKETFEQHLAKSVAVAESNMKETFHCKTPDCKGWCIYENTVNYFKCPICRKTNCLTCQAIHEGENCRQYQDRLKQVDNPESADGQRTRQMLEEMCTKGDAMLCPSCQVVLMKKWGCDWLKCSMCKTEICWVTRGPRWGPAGKGDISGGCLCGVNGVRCHPKCNYCH